jgi:hypothetical protein
MGDGGLGDKETRRQGDKETRRQGDKETRRQGDKETRRQGDIFTLSPCHSEGERRFVERILRFAVTTSSSCILTSVEVVYGEAE